MIRVDMQRLGTEEGDCLMACVASILECDLRELPVIHKEREYQWQSVLADALRRFGFRVLDCANDPAVNPPGYAIAIGTQARSPVNHACVARDGDVVHDPHPSREGLIEIIHWFILLPLARSRQVTAPSQLGPMDAAL